MCERGADVTDPKLRTDHGIDRSEVAATHLRGMESERGATADSAGAAGSTSRHNIETHRRSVEAEAETETNNEARHLMMYTCVSLVARSSSKQRNKRSVAREKTKTDRQTNKLVTQSMRDSGRPRRRCGAASIDVPVDEASDDRDAGDDDDEEDDVRRRRSAAQRHTPL